jgi:hypothetical protein
VIAPSQLIVILAAFLLCGGWSFAVATNPDRKQAPVGEAYGWPLILAVVFVVLCVVGLRYVAPELQRWLSGR